MARGRSRGHKGGRKQFSNPDQIKEDIKKVGIQLINNLDIEFYTIMKYYSLVSLFKVVPSSWKRNLFKIFFSFHN